MSVLIGKEIANALKKGTIRIDPAPDPSRIGPGSIDLTLGNEFRVFKKRSRLHHVRDDSRFDDITRVVRIEEGGYITLRPGEMILGITQETITLADTISGRLEGRSRFARFGLAVHVTAGFLHPGISNRQVLEIVNLGHAPLALHPGTSICQLIFERCSGRARYRGRFAKQVRP